MKEFTKYLIWAGVGLVALAGLINYFMVKSHNDKIINDSFEKSRNAKKAKAEKMKRYLEEIEKEVDEEFYPKDIIEDIEVVENGVKEKSKTIK